MLTRIRIEVTDEESAAFTSQALDRYESAVCASEEMRFGRKLGQSAHEILDWTSDLRFDSPDNFLGREVTDEVIQYDPGIPGYKGRRVVQFTRIDTRKELNPRTGETRAEEVFAAGPQKAATSR